MAFANDAGFEDDFRKVGTDVTAGFEPADSPFNSSEQGTSENLSVAPKTDDLDEDDDLEDEPDDDEDDDLEDDEDDLDEDDDEDELDDDPEGEEELEDDDEEDLDDDDDEDELDDDLEGDDDTVKARNTSTAASAVRSRN